MKVDVVNGHIGIGTIAVKPSKENNVLTSAFVTRETNILGFFSGDVEDGNGINAHGGGVCSGINNTDKQVVAIAVIGVARIASEGEFQSVKFNILVESRHYSPCLTIGGFPRADVTIEGIAIKTHV